MREFAVPRNVLYRSIVPTGDVPLLKTRKKKSNTSRTSILSEDNKHLFFFCFFLKLSEKDSEHLKSFNTYNEDWEHVLSVKTW